MKKFAVVIATALTVIGTALVPMTSAFAAQDKQADSSEVICHSIDAPVAFGQEDTASNTSASRGDQFIGTYACDRAVIDVEKDGDAYDVTVDWGNSAFDLVEWKYTCTYDAFSDTLVCSDNGTKTLITYDENGVPTAEDQEYSNGCAEFFLASGSLVWDDQVENAGTMMVFDQI